VATKGEVEVKNNVLATVDDVAAMTCRNTDVFDERVMMGGASACNNDEELKWTTTRDVPRSCSLF
jgi:hypothetical protein